MKKLKVYVGCGLTHAPETYKKEIAEFKQKLREISWIEVLDFVTSNSVLEKPDPKYVYSHDIHTCVGTAHAMIGDLTHPSIGLGWELATSVEKHVMRVLMCAKEGALVSNLPIGAALHNEHVTLHRYPDTIDDLFDFFVGELKSLHEQL